MSRPVFRIPVLLIAMWLLPGTLLLAQATADSLAAYVDEQRQVIVLADSLGDAGKAFDARMALAHAVGSKEALALMQQAAHAADSVGRIDLSERAYRELSGRYEALNRHQQAHAMLLRADSLGALQRAAEQARWEAERQALAERARTQQDSLASKAAEREHALGAAISALQRSVQLWMIVAAAVLLLGSLFVVILFYRAGRTTSRATATIAALKEKLEAQHAVTPPSVPEAKDGPVDEAMKPLVVAMFAKDGPERLATLQDARRRGDTEKIVRVVASLRPQLLNFDAERFAPLITRLKAPGAPADRKQWNADLDELAAGLEALLQHQGRH